MTLPSVTKRPPNTTHRIVLTDDEKTYMTLRYKQIHSLERVGDEMGITPEIIKRELAKMGVTFKKVRRTTEQIEAIKQDYMHSDLDIKQMCTKHDVGKNLIFKMAADEGWKRLVWKRKHFKDVWARDLSGKELAAKRQVTSDKQSRSSSGEGNPMFGKPSPQGSGNGWKGWYRGHYFRSLREVMFMIRMDKAGQEWTSAEGFTIPYTLNGVKRTYHPDFRVGNKIFEIKPKRLHKTPSVSAKAEGATAYCAKNGCTYHLIDEPIRCNWIAKALYDGKIEFAKGYRQRFIMYMVDHLEEIVDKIMKDETT